uniref:Lon protease homolog 2 n=1 Tax=Rhizophora mucronata TaxID=61149 RepID=A0A2P2KX22_RHIMU
MKLILFSPSLYILFLTKKFIILLRFTLRETLRTKFSWQQRDKRCSKMTQVTACELPKSIQ